MAKSESTISMIPTHAITLSRPTGKKDKDGNPIHATMRPTVGVPFDFTKAEHDELKQTAPTSIRKPRNENNQPMDGADPEVVQQARREFAMRAAENGGAPRDASSIAATHLAGKAEAPTTTEAEEEDEL